MCCALGPILDFQGDFRLINSLQQKSEKEQRLNTSHRQKTNTKTYQQLK